MNRIPEKIIKTLIKNSLIKESQENPGILKKILGVDYKDIENKGKEIYGKTKEAYKYMTKGMFSINTNTHKITFMSSPYTGAAEKAQELYSSWNSLKKEDQYETSKAGREWIKKNIYGQIEKRQSYVDNWGKQLGGEKESYWSSWTFGVCYKDDPDYSDMMAQSGLGELNLAFYPTGSSKRNLEAIKKDPEAFLNKTLYCLFDPKANDIPVFKGDGVFFSRDPGLRSYKDIPTKKGKPSHMRIVIDDSGMAIGGNEAYPNNPSKGTRIGKSSENFVDGKVTKKSCLGVFKKISVVKVEKLND